MFSSLRKKAATTYGDLFSNNPSDWSDDQLKKEKTKLEEKLELRKWEMGIRKWELPVDDELEKLNERLEQIEAEEKKRATKIEAEHTQNKSRKTKQIEKASTKWKAEFDEEWKEELERQRELENGMTRLDRKLEQIREWNRPSSSSTYNGRSNYDYDNYNYGYRNYNYDSYASGKSEDSKLSTAAIAGIVFGCLGFCIAWLLISWCLEKRKEDRTAQHNRTRERRVVERGRNRGDLLPERNINQPNQRDRRQMNERRPDVLERNRNHPNQRNREQNGLENQLNPFAQQDDRSFLYQDFIPPESEKMKKIIEKQTRNAKIIREPFAKPEFYVQCGEFFEDPPMFTPGTYRVTMSMAPGKHVLKLDVDDGGKISQPGQECEEIQNLTGLWFMPTGRVSLRFTFDGFLVQFRGEIENEEIQGRCKKGNELGTFKLKSIDAIGSLSSQQGFKDLTVPDFRFRFTQEFDGKVFETGSEDNECILCCDKFIDCALTPCGHLCACSDCATKLELCPICREVINQIVIPE